MSDARIADVAAAAGISVADLVEDFGNVAYSLAESTFIGSLAAETGEPAGQDLVDSAAAALADVAVYVGVDIDQLMVPEVGAPAQVLARATKYLRGAASVVAQKAAANPSGIIKAVLAIGFTTASALWLTENLIVRLAEVDQKKAAVSQIVAKVSPGDLVVPINNLTKPPGLLSAVPWWGWGIALTGAGMLAWRYVKRS